jgi:hypothetical protein
MNPAIKTSVLPSLTADYLSQSNVNIDNTFNAAWKRLGFKSMLLQAKFHKRSGAPVSDVVYLLMLWIWLKTHSVAMFSRDALVSFSATKKDALYDLLNREDVDWRKLHHLRWPLNHLASSSCANSPPAYASYDIFVHQLAVLLAASSRPDFTIRPLPFASS